MPLITTVSLAQGARAKRKKVLVKPLAAIEDLGSVTILCSDKAGTLTKGETVLDWHADLAGRDDANVLATDLPDSFFEGGSRSRGCRDAEVSAGYRDMQTGASVLHAENTPHSPFVRPTYLRTATGT